MNTPIITLAKTCIEMAAQLATTLIPSARFIALFAVVSFTTITVHAEWSVDFTRRAKQMRENELNDAAVDSSLSQSEFSSVDTDRQPASISTPTVMNPTLSSEDIGKKAEAPKGVFDQVFEPGEPVQEIVILNTEKGFVPNTVRVRKNARYKVSVVNVNEKEKNISFILDGFAEHHATYFGKVQTFSLQPNKEGVFSFQSPETAAEGKLVVYNPPITVRQPASNADVTQGSKK